MADANNQSSSERQGTLKDTRIACKYGTKCYQRSSAHLETYKHPPPKRNGTQAAWHQLPPKKFKPNDNIKNEGGHNSPDTQQTTKPPDTKFINTESTEQTQGETTHTKSPDIRSRDYNSESTEAKEGENTHPPTKPLDSEVLSSESTELEEGKNNEIEDSLERPVPSTTCGRTPKSFDFRDFIKEKFLVTMPEDFYQFWDYCKGIKSGSPQEALKNVGLELVGPYDVLAGKFFNVPEQPEENYLVHWRYYRDPPECQTILKGDTKTGFHIGYFRDSPNEDAAFLVNNCAQNDGVFKIVGDNVFAAVHLYLEDLKKSGDPFKKMHITKLQNSLKSKSDELHLSLAEKTQKIRDRNKKIVARSFNKLGFVVPYNRKTQVGYRDLGVSNQELMKLLTDIQKALPEQKPKFLSKLQDILTNVNIATDECDFGAGIELGLDILAHGVDSLNRTISTCLGTNYRLVSKEEFAKIIEAHMKNRKKGVDLSIV